MVGLLRLVQGGRAWAEPQPAQALPPCTKRNSPPFNGQCTNHCGFNMPIKVLTENVFKIKFYAIKT